MRLNVTSASTIPNQSAAPPSGPNIVAADRLPISCWGRHVRTVSSDQHSFTWSFLHAAVAFPVLGADFLEHFNFMVDIKNKRLVGPGRSYVQLSATQSSLNLVPVGVVANNAVIPAGVAQQPQAASLCVLPPAAVISTTPPAGGAQQPQAASLCARPPAAVISTASVAAEFPRVLPRSCLPSAIRWSM